MKEVLKGFCNTKLGLGARTVRSTLKGMSLLTNSKTGVLVQWITVTDIMVGSGGGKRELDAVPEHESNLDWAQCK